MPEGVSHKQLAIYAALAVAVFVLGARYLRAGPAEAPPAPALRVERDAGSRAGAAVTVHVAGAVRRPGVYELRAGDRVDDALRRAGGPTRRADLAAVNLAAKPEDGRQILVPERAPPAGAAPSAAAAPPATPGTPPTQPLNLNTATPEQLDTLDGIGPTLAAAIIQYRDENGGFGSIDELAQVPGIGEKRMASLREKVRV